MLVESLPKDPLAFQIMRFDNQKVNYTIMVGCFPFFYLVYLFIYFLFVCLFNFLCNFS